MSRNVFKTVQLHFPLRILQNIFNFFEKPNCPVVLCFLAERQFYSAICRRLQFNLHFFSPHSALYPLASDRLRHGMCWPKHTFLAPSLCIGLRSLRGETESESFRLISYSPRPQVPSVNPLISPCSVNVTLLIPLFICPPPRDLPFAQLITCCFN